MASTINAITTGAGGLVQTGDSSGALALQTNNGTTAVTIDTSQNVGIGTTSPKNNSGYSTLTLNNATNGGVLEFTNNNTSIAQIYNDSSALYIYGQSGKNVSIQAAGAAYIRLDTNGGERMRIDSSGYITNNTYGNPAGLVQGSMYYRLNSGYAGSNATGAQSLFGVGVTLAGSTVYEFEMVVGMIKSAGTTSHTIAIGFGGTATLNNIGYFLCGSFDNTTAGEVQKAVTGDFGFVTTSASTVITGAFTTAACRAYHVFKGTISINAGGTLIPQYALSAAPGGAWTVQAGSYVKISAISASGANTNIGSWA